jgi:hypothetical protein
VKTEIRIPKSEGRPEVKSEGRNPKSERRPKTEVRSELSRNYAVISGLGFRDSFGFRPSDFGLS